MPKVVISTIGTSLLTNQINRGNEREKNWYERLRDTANLNEKDVPEEALEIVCELQNRAKAKLESNKISAIRAASAELNGIYGLYNENLQQGSQDIHWLVATDTYQGKKTAEIVKDFLYLQRLNTDVYSPPGLSTASTGVFSSGIDNLITWLDEIVNSYKQSQYQVCFNLVGSFKSLQGYLNTIGMFYADEIIYIFEGEKSELIKIPRLPLTIDHSTIEPYKVELALMFAGASISAAEVPNISEALVCPREEQKLTLSNWGKLVWNQCKKQLLSKELLNFPRLEYRPSFSDDYKNIRDSKEKLRLQEDLAKVSCLLIESNGDTSALKQLDYERYKGSQRIDHFRVNLSQRVSCEASAGNLVLRYYGTHDHVQGKELPNKK